MKSRAHTLCSAISVLTLVALLLSPAVKAESFPVPRIPYAPREYVCYRTPEPLSIDGRLNESAWRKALRTEPFVDIEGNLKPAPRFQTRACMLWDSTYLYVAAELAEPHIWGTLTERDAVIYHDNDFEVFIDPDGDTHEYYELEMNALNTVWDLFLLKPYRDGGPAVNAWDIQGLKTAVALQGTLNNPEDTDTGWSVEIAIPWKVLAECAHRPSPPNHGDQWRINFSRVEWHTEVEEGKYAKVLDPTTGKSRPEDNWVWSPQGLIAMHYPETWGIVQFSTTEVGGAPSAIAKDSLEQARWALRLVYYAETEYRMQHGGYTSDWPALAVTATAPGVTWPPDIQTTTDQFEAVARRSDGTVILRMTQDGRLSQESARQ